MGDKKSPQTQITHTEQQAIKQNTTGRRWGHMVGIWIARGGGGRHLRKRSPLNGNQMGCVFLNRIPDLQRWREPGRGAFPLAPSWAEGTWRQREMVAGPEAATELHLDPGCWLRVRAPLTLPRCLPAFCQDLQIRSISRSSTISPFSGLSSNSFSLQYNFRGARKSSLFQYPCSHPHPINRTHDKTCDGPWGAGALQLSAHEIFPTPAREVSVS